jgi:hypothetical protein
MVQEYCDITGLILEAFVHQDISLMTVFLCSRTLLCSFGVVFLVSDVSVLLEVLSTQILLFVRGCAELGVF